MHIAAIVLLVVALVAALFLIGTAMTILYYLAAGLVVGALGRLVLPGREKIGLLGTALIGIAGSLIGGVIGRTLHVGRVLELVCAVAAAAVLLTVFGFRARKGEE